MAYKTLSVDPHGYAEAAVAARYALAEIENAARSAHASLSAAAHMGGNDASGGTFAHSYDKSAKAIFEGLGDLCTALSATSSAFDASAASHAAAETANAADASGAGAAYPAPASPVTVHFADPASAYGGTNIFPEGWTFIQNLVAGTWPDGDTDRMRAAARHWHHLADDIDAARSRHLVPLLDPLAGFQAPDIAAIEAATEPLSPSAKRLADGCREVADLCTKYASHVTEAHNSAINELAQFVATSAAAIGISAMLTPFTAGISDLVGGGAVAADAVVTAGEISETLGTLAARAASLAAKTSALVGEGGVAVKVVVKSSVFLAKSAYTGTIWGVSEAAGDLVVNGNEAHIGNDFLYAYAGGTVGRGFEAGGQTLARTARDSIDSGARMAARAAKATSTGPKHLFSKPALAASKGITLTFRTAGSGAGAATDDLIKNGKVEPSSTVKGTLKGLLSPSLKESVSGGRHVAGPPAFTPGASPVQ